MTDTPYAHFLDEARVRAEALDIAVTAYARTGIAVVETATAIAHFVIEPGTGVERHRHYRMALYAATTGFVSDTPDALIERARAYLAFIDVPKDATYV